ncbi:MULTISPECIES: HAAS signaling domain-containing protein [Arthrobacter]|uniref:HAAS signaling domain-containing protein n=1 Tax=Arthrobacter TaxID=1663 RepID=UPI0012650433|nr:hypothetical protein [Arthrobacter gandavensis]
MNADAVNKKLPESSLISAYLTSLERALAQSEDRDEIVASVREHIADALSAEEDVPDPRAVRLVLDELGPVERIANLSTEISPSAEALPASRPWGTVIASIAAGLSLILVFIVPFVAVPLAVVTLISGILILNKGRRRSPAAWLPIIVSTVTLLAALIGAAFFLPKGEAVPGPAHPAQSVPPPGETTPLDK